MKWAEISIRTSHEAMELVADIFYDLGASGVVIEDPRLLNSYLDSGVWDCTDLRRAEETDVVTVKAYLPSDGRLEGRLRELEERVGRLPERGIESGPGEIAHSEVQDEDWSETWKQYFHAEKIGSRIVICPSWETFEAGAQDLVIELDPGEAFGTGSHPTTSLCLRELERLVAPGMDVADVGTGSGVLAIAAARLGAAHVEAVDADPVAIRVARENIRKNRVGHVVALRESDLLANVCRKADLIIANIIADVILRLLGDLDAHWKPGGRLLCSGIIADRIPDVTSAADALGLAVEYVVEEQGWGAMVISRKDAP